MTSEEQMGEVIEYERCACGETETFIGRLRKKVEEKGISLEGYPQCLSVTPITMSKPGVPLVMGVRVPAGEVAFDVCMGCGACRAIRIVITEAVAGFDREQLATLLKNPNLLKKP